MNEQKKSTRSKRRVSQCVLERSMVDVQCAFTSQLISVTYQPITTGMYEYLRIVAAQLIDLFTKRNSYTVDLQKKREKTRTCCSRAQILFSHFSTYYIALLQLHKLPAFLYEIYVHGDIRVNRRPPWLLRLKRIRGGNVSSAAWQYICDTESPWS